VLNAQAQSPKSDFKKALKLYKSGEFRAAITILNQVLNEDSSYTEARYYRMLSNENEVEIAAAYADAVYLNQYPGNKKNYLLPLADYALRLNKYTKAIDFSKSYLQKYPEILDIYYILAESFISIAKYDSALAYCNIATTKFEANAKLYYFKAVAFDSLQNSASAIANYLKSIHSNPVEINNLKKTSFIYYGLANNSFKINQEVDAITYYNKCLEIDSVFRGAHVG
jgi:tetratricopeptide (TPR) repeat protein